jgi:hypothetical protein
VTNVIESFADIIDQSKLKDPESFLPQPQTFFNWNDEAGEPLTTLHQVTQRLVLPDVRDFFEQLKIVRAARSILEEYKSALPLSDYANQEIQTAFQELKKPMTNMDWNARWVMVLLVDLVLQHCMLLYFDTATSRDAHCSNTCLISQAQMNLNPRFLNPYPCLSLCLRTTSIYILPYFKE